jgi:hypothetical protein
MSAFAFARFVPRLSIGSVGKIHGLHDSSNELLEARRRQQVAPASEVVLLSTFGVS